MSSTIAGVSADRWGPGIWRVAPRAVGVGALGMRWVLLHMIEETARHNGHADILRELIDGATGE